MGGRDLFRVRSLSLHVHHGAALFVDGVDSFAGRSVGPVRQEAELGPCDLARCDLPDERSHLHQLVPARLVTFCIVMAFARCADAHRTRTRILDTRPRYYWSRFTSPFTFPLAVSQSKPTVWVQT
jgi:hypothetical protein